MNESSIGIVVLAAGASTRMGEPKQLMRFDGRALVRRAVDVALESAYGPVVVVLGARAERVREELLDTDAHIVVNEEWAEGMSSSIRKGVARLDEVTSGTVRAVIVTLCDQPFVTASVLGRLVDAYRSSSPLLTASEYEANGARVRGVPALFDRALLPELLGLRGSEGAKRVIERHASEVQSVLVPEAAFDVDTPSDYEALRVEEQR